MLSFSSNLSIENISLSYYHTCVLRCDGRVVCFGKNDEGQIGLGMFGGNVGDTTDMVGLINYVNFGQYIDYLFPDLLSITLSNGYVIPTTTCQSLYIVRVITLYEISVVGYTSRGKPTSVTVNGDPLGFPIALEPRVVNLIKVVSKTGSAEATYFISVRVMQGSFITAGEGHTCYLSKGKIACWGVLLH